MFLAVSAGGTASVSGATDGVQFTAFTGYTKSEVRWITEYDALIKAGGDPDRCEVLRRVMTEQRKKIWRMAQPEGDGKGWDFNNRRERYHSLLVRTKQPQETPAGTT
jgi:hypothetical protein